ncbi:hypothetical protein [Helicobacter trogontum]|uniref:Uncharacterized protein n=1 Tax=Helicobacter trogontum TaxID=50960 RepID=A0A4U8SC61_9HELI|nr:hypothetical protein [Helicobacter trogontum]TLD83655.1 hypothetical protein LS81_004580 [Helicobacter trogontum]
MDGLLTAKELGYGRSSKTRFVESEKELDELWARLPKNATKIEERAIPITKKKIGQTTQETLIRHQLDDKTQIVYRAGSKSGGKAIDIHIPSQKNMYRIHIKGGLQ